VSSSFVFFQAEDGIRDRNVTGVQTCALPIYFFRTLEAGQALAAEGDDVLLARALAGGKLDEGAGCLAPFLVRARHHGRRGNRRMLGQDVLDFDRGNVLTTGNDDVLVPVLDANVAIRLEHAEIAGVIPAVLERLRGGLRILEIAFHDDVAA